MNIQHDGVQTDFGLSVYRSAARAGEDRRGGDAHTFGNTAGFVGQAECHGYQDASLAFSCEPAYVTIRLDDRRTWQAY